METERVAGFAPQTRMLAESLLRLNTPCIGCKDCAGICQVLLDMIRVPDIVLKGGRA